MGSKSPDYPGWMSDEAMEEARRRGPWTSAVILWVLIGMMVAFLAVIGVAGLVVRLLLPGR
jgi:hypothetical protein